MTTANQTTCTIGYEDISDKQPEDCPRQRGKPLGTEDHWSAQLCPTASSDEGVVATPPSFSTSGDLRSTFTGGRARDHEPGRTSNRVRENTLFTFRCRAGHGRRTASKLGTRGQTLAVGPCDPPILNPIACENSQPGNPSSEWDISGAGDSSIQGFATDISVDQGQTVCFKIDTDATHYRLDIYRMGYYGGMGARKVATDPALCAPAADAARTA